MRLIDKINHLRLSAAFLFDLGKAKNQTSNEIANNIQPLSEKLIHEINKSSLKERVLAVKALEHQIEGYQLDKQYITEKILDCSAHVENIKNSLINELQDSGKISMIDDGFTLTLIDGNLNIR